MNETTVKLDEIDLKTITSLEWVGAAIAEECYKNNALCESMRKDPSGTVSRMGEKKTGETLDLKRVAPDVKIHALENTNKRWHIVLPIGSGDNPEPKHATIPDKELEDVNGAIFATIAAAFGISTVSLFAFFTGMGNVAVSAVTGATVFSIGGAFASSYAIPQVVAVGVVASIVLTGTYLSAGAIIGSIAGMEAAGVIG